MNTDNYKDFDSILGAYRFAFNGKEKDNEVKGDGNQLDYGYRIYDNRLGKFLSLDPLGLNFPFYTPYQFAGNKPIWAIDIEGLEETGYTRYLDKQYASANGATKANKEACQNAPYLTAALGMGLFSVFAPELLPGKETILIYLN